MNTTLKELITTVDVVVEFGEQVLGHLPESKRQLFAEMLDTLNLEAKQVAEEYNVDQ
jgi:hypothetical protein